MELVKIDRAVQGSMQCWEKERSRVCDCLFACFGDFFDRSSFEFSPGFADAQAAGGDSCLASRDGCAQQWVISSSPSPGVGTNDTSLPDCCLEAALGAQHCHQPVYRAARVILCHCMGDRKPYKTSLTNPCCFYMWAVAFRENSPWFLSSACSWVSLKVTAPTPVKYVGSRQKLLLVLHVKTMQ